MSTSRPAIVRTERFVAERNARRSLFGDYRNPYTNHPSVEGVDMGTANTTALFHAGKLFALKEDSRPVIIDPDSLETVGRWDFRRQHGQQDHDRAPGRSTRSPAR